MSAPRITRGSGSAIHTTNPTRRIERKRDKEGAWALNSDRVVVLGHARQRAPVERDGLGQLHGGELRGR